MHLKKQMLTSKGFQTFAFLPLVYFGFFWSILNHYIKEPTTSPETKQELMCSLPTNLQAVETGHTFLVLEWADADVLDFTEAYEVRWREQGTGTWTTAVNEVSPTFLDEFVHPELPVCYCAGCTSSPGQSLPARQKIKGLLPCTTYEFQVQKTCNNGATSTGWTASSTASTLECGNTYYTPSCYSVAMYAEYLTFTIFQMENIDYAANTTCTPCAGCTDTDNGYAYVTNTTTDLIVGMDVDFTYFLDSGSDEASGMVSLWMDLNQDGDFEDLNENLIAYGIGTGSQTFSYSIPSDATLGTTRFRIAVDGDDVSFDPCGVFYYGHVLDFDVNLISDVNPCVENDSLALVALYNATNGPGWTTPWTLSDPMNSWFGVNTDLNGCVTSLNVNTNNLVGTIPTEIGNLTNLETLQLGGNQLNGTLPVELGNLTNLTSLGVGFNQLTGNLPSELGNLLNLESLNVGDNQFDGNIPTILGNLSNLQYLFLRNTLIDGNIPPELGNLTNLLSFGLNGNQLTGSIPPELGNLTNVSVLKLEENQLEGTIPAELGNLTNLQNLRLQDNNLSGCYDPNLFNLCGVLIRDFSNNPLLPWQGDFDQYCFTGGTETEQYGAPCDDGDPITDNDVIQNTCDCVGANACVATDSLALVALYNATNGPGWNNPWVLSQPMNTWNGLLFNADGCVITVDLNNQNLDGTIPTELETIENLNALDLSANPLLIGAIPDLTNYTNLQFCILQNNGHSGGIPALNNNLLAIDISYNNLTGTIPPFTANNALLNIFDCSANNLDGTIPDIAILPDMGEFLCFENNLTGSIPDLSNNPNLLVFSCGKNALTGTIPDLTNNPLLEEFYCQVNQLSGSMPTDFTSNPLLTVFLCYDNDLAGAIPDLPSGGRRYYVQSNQYTFESILPNISNIEATIAANAITSEDTLSYAPQDSIFMEMTYNVNVGDPLNVNLGVDNAVPDNVYTWYQNGVVYATTAVNNLDYPSIQLSDAGTYWVHVTNPGAPDLTLESFPYTINVTSSCAEADSLALVALYNATDGANWTNNTNWLAPNMPINTWFGIQTSVLNGCLTNIDLNNNNLVGTLPPELGDLSDLAFVNLSNNQITGGIPTEYGNISTLISLNLGNNQLTGTIPTTLGNLTNLSVLWLADNQLSGSIPTELGNLTNIDGIFLSNNQLTGSIPAELGALTNMSEFWLFDNQLTGSIPTELGNLTNLTILGLYNNQLSGNIPTSLGNLNSLIWLQLYNNQLTGSIPSQLGNLNNLSILRLNDNNLNGCFDPNLFSLCGVATRDFSNNPLLPWQGDFDQFCGTSGVETEQYGVLCDDGNASTVNDVIDNTCTCAGTVVNACVESDSLALVALYNATNGVGWTTTWDLTMPMSTWFGITLNGDGCVDCIDLDGDSNCLTFSGPGNGLVGALPSELGNLSQARYLHFGNNGITGAIPTELGNITTLSHLSLRSNEISATIPVELGNLSNLTYLELNDNAITGSIPSELGNLNNLLLLAVDSNALTGNIPLELGNLSSLVQLLASDNQLSGIIPGELGNLNNMTFLALNNNTLTGSIPPELENLSSLQGIALYSNNLTGSIPPELGNLPSLTYLSFEFNQLSGSIPVELGNISTLEILTGHNNNISGSLPAELGNLTNLIQIALYNNNLDGAIPPELGNLNNLLNLWLHQNQLTGTIPGELGNLSSLSRLDLSDNNLSGCFDPNLFNLCGIALRSASNNPLLPWQGDFDQFCATTGTEAEQYGASCDDGNVLTLNDVIDNTCTCAGVIPNPCIENDSLALVALYNATDGANWTNSWDLNMPMSTWFGVTLNGDGCVLEISLSNNQLTGTIPSEIGSPINLTDLDLSANTLSGTIPTEIGNLSNLTRLLLTTNQLTGSIPDEIGNLTNLNTLGLFNNQLTGSIPTTFGNLTSLTGLALFDNQLTGNIPTQIGNLTNLNQFIARDNLLTGSIPAELGNLNNLTILSLFNNQLTGTIPPELGNLNNLTSIVLNDNNLSGCFDPNLFNLCGVTTRNFSNNPLLPWQGDFDQFCATTGTEAEQYNAPCDDGNAVTLNDVIDNTCTCLGIPPSTCVENDSLSLVALFNATDGANWTNTWDLTMPMNTWLGITLNGDRCVAEVMLDNNQLAGTLPTELGNLANLTNLLLNDNSLDGCYDPNLINLCGVTTINFSNNLLLPWQGDIALFCATGGTEAEQYGTACDDGNALTINDAIDNTCTCVGTIPDPCIENDSLSLVALFNATDGPNWTNTWDLNMPMNTWFGVTLNGNRCVAEVLLDNNQLTGTLPTELGNLANVTDLLVNDNNLSGCYDPNLFNLCGVNNINFSNNLLLPWQGDIALFCATGGTEAEQYGTACDDGNALTINDVIDNTCTCVGTIPDPCIENDSLSLVALYNATDGPNWTNTWDLTMPMSTWFGVTLNGNRCVAEVMLGNNQLTGTVPTELGNLANITDLLVNDNNLSGCYDPNLFNLCGINNIDFSNNLSLPWQGDITQFCVTTGTEAEQYGAPCDDGNSITLNDVIDNTCTCIGIPPNTCVENDSLSLVALYDATDGANWTNIWDLTMPMSSWFGVTTNVNGCVTEVLLSNNQLTGTLPTELGNLANLTDLLLNDNDLNGCYDPNLFNLCGVNNSDFSNNPLLPWQGDLNQFCATTGTEAEQYGASCDDGNALTLNDVIDNTCTCAGAIPNTCVENDSLALVALYNATDGPNWTSTWDLSMPMNSWFGVTTNADGCVAEVLLSNNQLAGTVPTELGNLTNLTDLFLNDNNLNGCYDPNLLNLCLVNNIDFSNNPLLPWLGDLNTFCATTGMEAEQYGASCDDGNALTLNDVIDNTCTCAGIPPNTCVESDSLALVALYNATDGQNWTNIWDLTMPMNTWFGVTTNADGCVAEVLLSNNQLTGTLPTELGDLANLTDLLLNDNSLSGCYDPNLFNLCGVNNSDFSNNSLLPWQGDLNQFCATTGTEAEQYGASCDDGNPITLNDVIDNTCNCTGTIQNACVENDSLSLVALYNATDGANWTNAWNLTMPMNSWFGITLNGDGCVADVALPNNQLTGTIPAEIGNLANLGILDLSSNQLSGFIPSEIGDPVNLTEINISNNNLTGSIPGEIGNLNNLTDLLLNNNNLDGCYDPNLFNLCASTNGNFSNNTLLPWQGDFDQFCLTGGTQAEQEGTSCDDGNAMTGNDMIQANCSCAGTPLTCFVDLGPTDTTLCAAPSYTIEPTGNWVSFVWSTLESTPTIDVTSSGTYSVTVTDNGGCTAEDVINVNFANPIPVTELSESYCEGEAGFLYTGDGQTYTDGFYNITLTSTSSNCDSLVELTVTEQLQSTNTINADICTGDIYTINLVDYNTTGTHTEVITNGNSNGCDSTIVLNLTVDNQVTNSFSAEICEGQQYVINNVPYTTTGVFSETVPNGSFNGCDSLIILDLTVNPTVTNEFDAEICTGETYFIVGVPYTTSGTHTETDIGGSSSGCDSIVIVNLTVSNEVTNSFSADICEGESYIINDVPYTTTGLHTETIFNGSLNGCDSLIVLDLTVNTSVTNNLSADLCNGEEYVINNMPYNFTGIHMDTVFNGASNGCDSIIVLDLLIYDPVPLAQVADAICDGDVASVGGMDFTTSGSFTVTIQNSNGCDSTINLDLTVYPLYDNILTETICEGELFTAGGADYDISGNYVHNLTSWNGCDSIVTLNLSVADEATFGAAEAGTDQVACEENTVLSANLPPGTFGEWISSSGSDVNTPFNATSSVDNLEQGANYFSWSLSVDGCPSFSTDSVLVLLDNALPEAMDDELSTQIDEVIELFNPLRNDDLFGLENWEINITNPPFEGQLTQVGDSTFNYIPSIGFKGEDSFEYEICNSNCIDFCEEATVRIVVESYLEGVTEAGIIITPNGDDKNEFLTFDNLEDFPNNELFISNRWGTQVFNAAPYLNDWSGQNQRGNRLPNGTYYYIIKLDIGEGEFIRGSVTVRRD